MTRGRTPKFAVALIGAFLLFGTAHAQVTGGATSRPSGTASGDLSGTYPSPAVATIGGKAVTQGGAATADCYVIGVDLT